MASSSEQGRKRTAAYTEAEAELAVQRKVAAEFEANRSRSLNSVKTLDLQVL